MPDLLQSCSGLGTSSPSKPEKQKRFWSIMHKAKQLFSLQIQQEQTWGDGVLRTLIYFGCMDYMRNRLGRFECTSVNL